GPLADFFTACYVSGELGLLKPHAEIYRHVLGDLGITPAEAVFIDNRASNVAGAEALGITGHVFTDAGRLREFLTSLAPATAGCPGRGAGWPAAGLPRAGWPRAGRGAKPRSPRAGARARRGAGRRFSPSSSGTSAASPCPGTAATI